MEKQKHEVYIRVYELNHLIDNNMISALTNMPIGKIYHTSIEIHGEEVYFGYGINKKPAGTVLGYGPLVDKKLLGYTECTSDALEEFINLNKDTIWALDKYHVLKHNCNHFSNTLSQFLVGKEIPYEYMKLADNLMNTPIG